VLSRAAVQTPDQPSPALSLSRPLLVLTRSRRAVQEKYQLVLQLTNPDTREGALLELSKRRESFGDLAPILWHSFGTMAALLQEIVSIYPLLSPPSLVRKRTARAARRSLSLSLSLSLSSLPPRARSAPARCHVAQPSNLTLGAAWCCRFIVVIDGARVEPRV
jgi:hypothetical protein